MPLTLGTSFAKASAGASSVKRMYRGTSSAWNADAADWVSRVYAAGATVSSSTANAVTAFCNAIDAAGIRDRFYRMGIFAGSSLTAALVPLYRGPSLAGTQYGNATDTNNGPFVSADYAETGAAGGLDPNGNGNKHLNTGYKPLDTGSAIVEYGHVCWWSMTLTTARQNIIGARKDSAPASFAGAQIDNLGRAWGGWGTGTTSINSAGSTSAPFFGSLTRRSDGRVYYRINDTAVTDAASSAPNGTNANFAVFAMSFDTGSFAAGPHRMSGYSVGAELSAQQASSLYDAWNTFQIALGRK